MKKSSQQHKVVWSSENVANWLTSNGWSSVIDVFNDYNIHHDRFLNLSEENLDDLLKNMNVSTIDKQHLIFGIEKLKADDQALLQQQKPRIAIPRYQRNSDSSIATTNSAHSTSVPLINTSTSTANTTNIPTAATPTTPINFDISQYIPKRTSSSDTNVSKMLENFHPTLCKISSGKPRSPRVKAADPDILLKLFGKRLPVPTLKPQNSRIQVTLDADTFVRLWIRQDSSAADIKRSILHKLSISADHIYFYFYHENGRQSSKPLVDEELVYICTTSNDNQTNRILVVPHYGLDLVRQQLHSGMHYVLSSSQSPLSYGGVQLVDLETPNEEAPLIDLVPTLPSNAFWATPPSTTTAARRPSATSPSLWHIPPSITASNAGPSAWPVGDQRQEMYDPSPSSFERGFEGISLYDPPTPVHDEPQSKFPTTTSSVSPVDSPPSPVGSDKRPDSHQSGESSSTTTWTATTATKMATPRRQSSCEDDVFGERPTVERLYRDIDKYLPGHDLDQEILVDQQQQQQQSSAIAPAVSRRLLGHRQSVRFVAKEAHRRWKQAANNVMVVNNLMMRRKSTKMWDQPIERVKPGEEGSIEISPHSSSLEVIPNKMVWMRGNLIGRGSFGRVYHAYNIATGEWFAVKQVDAVVTQSDKRNVALQEASDALYREILLLKDLDHVNIVQYLGYNLNMEEGHIYIFLEYVPGGSISSLLSEYKCLDESLTKFFTRQILQGLHYLHKRHILHRDIKGGNVLIDNDGVCKITDFGLSKNQQQDSNGAYDGHSSHTQMKGTLYWMAPEVLTNKYSAKVDVWSLGCTVLEMITGEHPWMELTTLAALYQIGLHNAPAIPENISDEAKDFLGQCLRIKPEDRPTATELLAHPFVQIDPSFDFKESLKQQRLK
ncbi:kinase-like domain-containing protein [Parasitella parasitica]|nr:kinase-like domain-containing protein [Parasitella parasitica]